MKGNTQGLKLSGPLTVQESETGINSVSSNKDVVAVIVLNVAASVGVVRFVDSDVWSRWHKPQLPHLLVIYRSFFVSVAHHGWL